MTGIPKEATDEIRALPRRWNGGVECVPLRSVLDILAALPAVPEGERVVLVEQPYGWDVAADDEEIELAAKSGVRIADAVLTVRTEGAGDAR